MGQKAKPVNSAMFNSAVCDLNSFRNETILALIIIPVSINNSSVYM